MAIIGSSWLLLAAAAGAGWLSPPPALHGLWFPVEDADGHCQRLLAASDPWEHEGSLLIGGLWIDDQVLHRWAEYGEGDIHQVVRSVQVSPAQWQLEVMVGIDTWPDPELDAAFPLRLSLSDGVLLWDEQTSSSRPRSWKRCTDTPPPRPE